MFAFVWAASIRLGMLLRRFMPSNILLDAIHTRRGLKWGVPAMLLAVPYLFAALLCAGLAQKPDAVWMNLLVLLFVWDAMKFLVAGPVTLVRLLRVRRFEARMGRLYGMPVLSEGVDLERVDEPALVRAH